MPTQTPEIERRPDEQRERPEREPGREGLPRRAMPERERQEPRERPPSERTPERQGQPSRAPDKAAPLV